MRPLLFRWRTVEVLHFAHERYNNYPDPEYFYRTSWAAPWLFKPRDWRLKLRVRRARRVDPVEDNSGAVVRIDRYDVERWRKGQWVGVATYPVPYLEA